MGIDYVVPMVFNDDPSWRDGLRKIGKSYDETNTEETVRYRSWGTERLLIKAVKKNMPWLRRIYVLLAQESQKKSWMDEEGVCVVYHREIIPSQFLPTFNSRTIEMFLKNIPNISEQFIYGNDDMFPLSPMEQEDFFVDGKPCLHHKEKPLPEDMNAWHMACLNGLNFVAAEFGKHYDKTILKGGHSLAPILLSTCNHLWNRDSYNIIKSITPTRTIINFNQYIYSWWQHLSGEYVDKTPKRKYVSTKYAIQDIVDAINEGGIVCINDNECVDDYMVYGNAVAEAIERKLME